MPRRDGWLDLRPQSVKNLPSPWFGVDHGSGNLEEAIRLDEVQAFRISYDAEDSGLYRVEATLRGGAAFRMSLNTKGANALVKGLKELEKKRAAAAKEQGA